MSDLVAARPTTLPARGRFSTWIACAVLVVVVGTVYGRALHAPFVHDDNTSVVGNPSIVRLWPPVGTPRQPGPLNPPRDAVTSGRPVVNLSLALNYAVGGFNTFGYHLVNLVVHLLASLALYGLVRRTLLLEYFGGRMDAAAAPLALAVALVWAIHPLQTDSVEYVSQRTESLMGLFYLAMLYASVRYFTAATRRAKMVAAVAAAAACVAGMGCKEVMVSAPLMALLFDRTIVSGSFRAALKKSWPLYAGLASGWLLLLALNLGAPRSHAAGLQAGLSPIVWWFTQAKVTVLYLGLSFWPWPLVIHRETPILWTFGAALPWLVPVALLAVATIVLLWRRSSLGYLGAWFFVILAPTFAVPMPSEVMAERRMYLALAPIVVLVVMGAYELWARLERSRRLSSANVDPAARPTFAARGVLIASLVVALIFAGVSSYRLEAYRDAITLWRDTVARQPQNVRGTINLGCALEDAGRHQEAIETLKHALQIDPASPDAGLAHRSLGLVYATLRQPQPAIEHLRLAMRLRPDVADDHGALGSQLLAVHNFGEAAQELELAVQQQPTDILGYANLATAYANLGRRLQAVQAAENAHALAKAQGATDWAAQVEAWLRAYRGGLTQR
jgi:Tfp pilus assembly protein PilF